MLVPLSTSGVPVDLHNFWNAIFIYHDRPHLINRKLSGSVLAHSYRIKFNESSNKISDLINYIALNYETNKLEEINKVTLHNLTYDLLAPYDKNVEIIETEPDEIKQSVQGVFISVRILYPSNSKSSDCVELVLIDKNRNFMRFVAGGDKNKFTLVAPSFPYTFEFIGGTVRLIVDVEDADSGSAEWLAEKLFPKIMKWAEDYDGNVVNTQSLSSISVQRYCQLYRELKNKYGKRMVDIWPENTDPLKFVYEDVAIATYLICLWERLHGDKKPSFVDLGCGNGLLVYILTQEGHLGFGIDVRKRKIWDLYPETCKLEVKTIIPSESSLFPTTDWIIGNHSDELTPWIPVIAARSSPTTKFFVLPCCSYDFNGSKYIRKNPKKSQYNEYLDYVETISRRCGFAVEIDRLRIPSTKRICLIGAERADSDDRNIRNLIDEKCGSNKDESIWAGNFQARSDVERVRNCTQLDRNLIDRIVADVVAQLLRHGSGRAGWNAGGVLTIRELIDILDADDLKRLKKECGGLQTLLKNHRYIFEVAKGTVKIRVPSLLVDVGKYKSKPCWFVKNHPDGCLHSEVDCAYGHV